MYGKIQIENLTIDFGKAGKTLAADLAKHGRQVILVELSEQMYGGTCINIGCISSKKLLIEGEYGHYVIDKEQPFSKAMARKNALIDKLRTANYNKLTSLEYVGIINASTSFVDRYTVYLWGKDGEMKVEAQRIFTNTGSNPVCLGIEGVNDSYIYDSMGIPSFAKRQAITNPKNTVYSIKRFIDKTYEQCKKEVERIPFAVVGENGYPRVDIESRKYTPQEISAMILQKMKKFD